MFVREELHLNVEAGAQGVERTKHAAKRDFDFVPCPRTRTDTLTTLPFSLDDLTTSGQETIGKQAKCSKITFKGLFDVFVVIREAGLVD